jgi:MFS family permease
LNQKKVALFIILMSYSMIVVDISIAITGLPSIQRDFGLSIAQLSWVQNAYTLVFGGLLLLGARAGDIFGRKNTFVAGLAFFATSSLLIGLSVSGGMLIAFRASQGIGAALLAPATLALLSDTFPSGNGRTKAFGAYAAVAGAAATVGLVLGGLFAGYLNWRVGFFINPPIAIVLFILSKRNISENAPVSGRFDLVGAILSTSGMSLIVYSLVQSTGSGSRVTRMIWLAPVGLLVLTLFFAYEKSAVQPIVPLHIFRNRVRNGALITRLLFLGAMAPFWFFTSQFLQLVLGFSPQAAGIAFLPITLVNFAVAWFTPKLVMRYGNRNVLIFGLLVTTIGMLWLAQLNIKSSYFFAIAGPMLLLGAGQGLVFAPLTAAGVSAVSPGDSGAASGVANVAHQLGGSLGLAIEIFISTILVHGAAGVINHGVLASRISSAFFVGSNFLVIALFATYFTMSKKISSFDQLSN